MMAMKELVSVEMVPMGTVKKTLSVLAMVAERKKCFIKKFIDANYYRREHLATPNLCLSKEIARRLRITTF